MIQGLGNDIIEIGRMKEAVDRHGESFFNRLFTEEEQIFFRSHVNPFPHIAGRFAAKESVAKAFGTGFGKEIGWKDIEIRSDPLGKPIVYLSPRAAKRFKGHLLLSISHCKEYASAVAIWITE